MPATPSADGDVTILLTLDDACADDPQLMDRVVQSCRQTGLRAANVMKDLGVISGSAAPAQLDALRGLPHVESVEVSQKRRAS